MPGVIEDERLAPTRPGMCRSSTRPTGWATRSTRRCSRGCAPGSTGFTLPPLSAAAGGVGAPPRIVFGTILSGDQYIHCEATRRAAVRELGGAAVEMEGGALGQVAEAFGIPFLDIRALSDLAGRDSRFDFAAFVSEVAGSSAVILRHLLPVL